MKKIFLVSASFFLFQSAFAAVHSVENISEKVKGDRLSLADVNSILGTIRGFFFDDSTGFVGIGTDSPSAKLEIKSNNGSNGIIVQNEGNDSWLKLKTNSENWVISNDGNDNFNNGSLVFSSDDGQDFRMIIENTGNIGIGTPYPSTKLEVSAGSDVLANVTDDSLLKINQAFPSGGTESDYKDAAITLGVSTPHAKIAAGATFLDNRPGHLSFFTRNSTSASLEEALRIDANGNMGIGTDSPSAKLTIYDINTIGDTSILMDGGWDGLTDPKFFGSGKISVGKSGQAAYAGQIKIQPRYYNGSNYEFREDALVVDATGNVGVGANDPSYKLQVNGSIYAESTAGALSDARHKNNIENLKYGLDEILELRPISFEWNADKVADAGMEGSQLGLIAQEVEAVFPEVILTQNDEAQTKAIKYSALLVPLIQAVKDLNQEIVQLKSEIEQMKKSQN